LVKDLKMMMCGASLVSGWIEFSSGQKIVRFEIVKHCLEFSFVFSAPLQKPSFSLMV